MQPVQPVAPVLACKVAAPQLVHAVDPADAEYVPAAQLTHDDKAAWPDCVEYVPAKQLVHALAPACIWYFPAPHAVQADAEAAEYWPAAHAPVAALSPAVAQ